MIEANERGGLRHAVALNDGITHALEKVLGFIRKRRTTGDKGPKLPAKAAVDSAKHPGAPEKFSALRVFKSAVQPLRFVLAFEFPLDSRMKKIKHARNGDERGGAFLLDGANDFGGIAGRFENERGSEERWNEQGHELAEDVAQGNERDEAQRVKPALVFAIRFDAPLQRLQVRQKIAVRENDPARIGRRARSVKNFGNGAARGCITRIHAGICHRCKTVHDMLEIVDDYRRRRPGQLPLLTVTQDELHAGILDRALNEIGGRGRVHRDNDAPTQEDSPEAGNPFGGVGPPEKDALTWHNSAPSERLTPEKGIGVKPGIRQLFPAVAASLDDSGIAGEAGEISEKTQEIFSGHKCSSLFASNTGRFYA